MSWFSVFCVLLNCRALWLFCLVWKSVISGNLKPVFPDDPRLQTRHQMLFLRKEMVGWITILTVHHFCGCQRTNTLERRSSSEFLSLPSRNKPRNFFVSEFDFFAYDDPTRWVRNFALVHNLILVGFAVAPSSKSTSWLRVWLSDITTTIVMSISRLLLRKDCHTLLRIIRLSWSRTIPQLSRVESSVIGQPTSNDVFYTRWLPSIPVCG